MISCFGVTKLSGVFSRVGRIMGLLFDPPDSTFVTYRLLPSTLQQYTIDISHGSPANQMYKYHCVMFRKYQSFGVLAQHLGFSIRCKGILIHKDGWIRLTFVSLSVVLNPSLVNIRITFISRISLLYSVYIVCLTHSYKSTILDRFHTKYNLPVYLLLKKIQYYSTLAHRIRKKQPELGYTCIWLTTFRYKNFHLKLKIILIDRHI